MTRLLTDAQRDALLVAAVRELQRQHRPLGHDTPTCLVCGARIGPSAYGPEPHRADCPLREDA